MLFLFSLLLLVFFSVLFWMGGWLGVVAFFGGGWGWGEVYFSSDLAVWQQNLQQLRSAVSLTVGQWMNPDFNHDKFCCSALQSAFKLTTPPKWAAAVDIQTPAVYGFLAAAWLMSYPSSIVLCCNVTSVAPIIHWFCAVVWLVSHPPSVDFFLPASDLICLTAAIFNDLLCQCIDAVQASLVGRQTGHQILPTTQPSVTWRDTAPHNRPVINTAPHNRPVINTAPHNRPVTDTAPHNRTVINTAPTTGLSLTQHLKTGLSLTHSTPQEECHWHSTPNQECHYHSTPQQAYH